ncbi:hypothetical protein LSCM1_02075 [Leishmania martiniquensis]|uniref:Uncharacterized protein n=1 Tax=Leishmania martiniquensis TaxID=1580590 RepID=A0A836GM66_9TRYP|nr:hypothetical protein LSCM1_02075 [Leishmania martiniquensis]
MSSPTLREERKTGHNSSWSSCDSLPNHLAHPPRHPQYLEAASGAPSPSSSSTLSSALPSPKRPVPPAQAMSCTASTMPSSKLPFSNSVTGTGAALIGPLASFDSEVPRGRPTSAAECRPASCSSGLSRAAVLLSGLGDASPPATPQPSASVLAAFCPLTSEAWQSGTIREGPAADADKTSTGSHTAPGTALQSPLLFSPGWPQQGGSVAAHDTLRSRVGMPERYLMSNAAEGDDAENTVHDNAAAYSTSRPPAPKDFTPFYRVQSSRSLAMDFTLSPSSEVSLSAQLSIRAPRGRAAKGTGATPAPSSCLPSDTLERHSLLRSPLLRSLTPPFIAPRVPLSPGLGCIMGTDQAQSRLSRHRPAASAGPEERLARVGGETRSPGAAERPTRPAAASSLEDEALDPLLASPVRHNFRGPLRSPDEESLPSFFAVSAMEMYAAPATANVSEEDAAHGSTGGNALCSGPAEVTEAEERATGTAESLTADDPFEVFWGIKPIEGWGRDTAEMPLHCSTSARFEESPVFRDIAVFASETPETGDRLSEEVNQHHRLSHAANQKQRDAIVHRPSAEQQRNSVNGPTDSKRTSSKDPRLQQRHRRVSTSDDNAIEIKRRSGA